MRTKTAPSRCKFFKQAMMERPARWIKCALNLVMVLGGVGVGMGLIPGVGGGVGALQAAPVGSEVRQLILSVAPNWDTNHGRLQCFERDGNGWKPTSAPWTVLYGKNGLAWGRGLHGADLPGLQKV